MVEQIIKISLSNESREQLFNLLRLLPLPTPFNLTEIQSTLLQNTTLFDKHTISEILKFKVAFLSKSFASFLLLENCPVGELSSTPLGKDDFAKPDNVSENFLILIGLIFGYPIVYAAETESNLIDNIVAVPELAETRSNAGYKVFLDYHVDLAHLSSLHTPDYTLLFALRGDEGEQAKTFCLSAQNIIKKLTSKEISILRKPLFRIEIPDSCKRLMKTENRLPKSRSLISGPAESPEIAFELNSTVAINEEAQKTLKKLKDICRDDEIVTEVVLRKGMLLIIRNKSAVHARSCYTPNWDGNQRWLQRLYVVSDLWKMRARLSSESSIFQGVI